MRPQTCLVPLVVAALFVAPGLAAAEKVVLRSGEIHEGELRFDGPDLFVKKADGTETKLPRKEVERIELTGEAAERRASPKPPPPIAPDAAPEGGEEVDEDEDERPPAYRPRRPPAPPKPAAGPTRPPPFRPRRPPPEQLPRSYAKSGLAFTLGYHRGLAAGLEAQHRGGPRDLVGFGVGAQLGTESSPDAAFLTYGGTARLYLGREHRFVSELGFGLNLIDPYLGRDCGGTRLCPVKSWGPEASVGYQYVAPYGLMFELLGGAVWATDEAFAAAHGTVHPAGQLSLGYLFN